MKKTLFVTVVLLLLLTFFCSNLTAVKKSPEIKPSPNGQPQVVLGNFITTGSTYPTVVNLLYNNKNQQVKIEKIFNPEKVKPETYFKKGLSHALKKWNLDPGKMNFEILKYKSGKATGAYSGYFVLTNNK